jgi:hypothetical protein
MVDNLIIPAEFMLNVKVISMEVDGCQISIMKCVFAGTMLRQRSYNFIATSLL